MIVAMIVLQILLVVGGPLLLAWWVHRRFGASWSSWGWGALTWTVSQMLLRIPLLAVVTIALRGRFADMDPDTAFWINLVVLTISAALFEEVGRYLVMRYLGKNVRDWKEGVMFGAGHGGIEAILLVGLTVAVNLVLILAGERILAMIQNASPDQVEILRQQIESLRTMAWWMPFLSVWERALAIVFHISASLLVLRAVVHGEQKWLWLSVLWHTFLNAAALLAVRYTNPVATEGILTVITVLAVVIILRSRAWFNHGQGGMAAGSQGEDGTDAGAIP